MGPRRGGGAKTAGRKSGGKTPVKNQSAEAPPELVASEENVPASSSADVDSTDVTKVSDVAEAILEDLQESATASVESKPGKKAKKSAAKVPKVEANESKEEFKEQLEQRVEARVTELTVETAALDKGNGECIKVEDVDTQDLGEDTQVVEVESVAGNVEETGEGEPNEEGKPNKEGERNEEGEPNEQESENLDDGVAAAVDNPEEDVHMEQDLQMSERKIRKKLEVFVGGIHKDATEEDMKEAFKEVGEVTEVRLMKNPLTGKNKGYGFVRFATSEQAKRAVSDLASAKVRGKTCGVLPSEENDTLFVGNINKAWNKENVMEKIKELQIENLDELNLMEDLQNEGCNRGFAFLGFMTHKDALIAFKRLQQRDVLFGSDKPAKVAWAQPLQEPDEATMSQVKAVFVEGMPPAWDEAKAKEFFGKYGEIERVVLAKNMPSAKRSDYGFINYVNREAALACIDDLKSSEITHGDVKMKLKVVLAKPPPNKGKQLKGTFKGGASQLKQTGINVIAASTRPGGGGRGSSVKPSIRGGRGGSGRGQVYHAGSSWVGGGYATAASVARGNLVSNATLLALHGQDPEAMAYNRYSAAVRQYGGAVPGMKRPFSAMDDPRHSNIAIRNAQSRVDLQGERAMLGHAYHLPGVMTSTAHVPSTGATVGGLGHGGTYTAGVAGSSVYGAASIYSQPGSGRGFYY